MEDKKDIEINFTKIKKEAEYVWESMDSFYNFWEKIFKGCEKNNIVELFEEWDSLHIAIYNNWKEKSDTCKQFQQSLKIILRELKIAKVVETFDMDIIEEISQEVQKFLEATNSLMEDKYCIEDLTEKYIKTVNEELKNQHSKNTSGAVKKETSTLCSAVRICAKSFYTVVASPEVEVKTKKIGNKFRIDGLAELSRDLSKLPYLSIAMNVTFKNLGDLIIEPIQNISVGAIDTEIRVERLIYITQELQKIFDITYHKASEYEGISRVLVIKSNPRFLINQ